GVVFHEGVTVTGLRASGGRVSGVDFMSPAGAEYLDADLVVDAMGRGSSVPDWLVEAGWPEATVQTLDAKVTYVSRWYDIPDPGTRSASWWWHHMVIMPTQAKGDHPDEHEYLVNFFPIEGNRSIACIGSWGLPMPKTTDDFQASADRLRTPQFAAAMAASEPTSEVHLTRSTGNKWRRYDRLRKVPLGVVFVGDSICAFNPFYGQGMSSAAISARLLSERLAKASALDEHFFADFLKRQAKEFKVPWGMA